MSHDRGWPAFQGGSGYGGGYGGGGDYGGGYGRRPRRRNPLRAVFALLVVLAVLGGAAVAAYVVYDRVDDIDLPGAIDPDPVDAHSAQGLDDMRDDVREQSGGTEVFRAVIYPDYAVVDVPADARSKRQESFRWDGDLDDFGGKGTATGARVDLADVDAEVMLEALAEAKGLVEDPETWYVVVEGRTDLTRKPSLFAYASNDFSETVYVQVALDGTEIRRLVGDEVIEAPVSRG